MCVCACMSMHIKFWRREEGQKEGKERKRGKAGRTGKDERVGKEEC